MARNEAKPKPKLGTGEFVALMALLTSLVAVSIDAMLPALAEIGADLGTSHENEPQLVVTALFVGLTLGQLVAGPVSDSIGRKPAIGAGITIFIVGCLLSIFATNFAVMLIGRVLQGIGAAAPRVATMALIRDEYEGAAMARILSFVMAVFILVPMAAPAMGQVIVLVANWRLIFAVLLIHAVVALAWLILRQPETLPAGRRRPFSFGPILSGMRETCTNRIALGYTFAGGMIFGALIGYLTSAQQVFQSIYGVGALFPLYFAVNALSIGAASLVNAKLVMRFGMQPLARWALRILVVLWIGFLVYAVAAAGKPNVFILTAAMMVAFFCIGVLFSNFNALAMEPLGHIAGVGAAVVGMLQTLISLVLGTFIGQSYNGTVLPLVIGFAVLALASLAIMTWTERGRAATSAER
ncbi:MAG: multidrug effflux MFS transporter [Alphaproteobacteria bacterium]|nr:multidrug effflux MFS transporter [Alphaproteobacteria bacterium]